MSTKLAPRPYIGITGFKKAQDVTSVSQWASNNSEDLSCIAFNVMFGFTCSNKRLRDKWSEGSTSPNLLQLQYLLEQIKCKPALPMIHYFTDFPENLVSEVRDLFSNPDYGNLYNRHLCRALQINQDWPKPEQLQKIKKDFEDLQIVVQLSPASLQLSNEEVINRSKDYFDLADFILIDPSGGQGKQLDLNRTKILLNELQDILPSTRIGVAGGLSPDNVAEFYTNLACSKHYRFCLDAQGKLRSDGELDPVKAIKYLQEAAKSIKIRNVERQRILEYGAP